MKRIVLVPLLFATAAFAGPYDQPYSIITTDRARSADPKLRPVIVNRVDGATVPLDNRAVVEPGKRQLTLDLPPRKGFKLATQQTMELEVKPCTLYHVAARLDSPTTQEWAPVVRSEEAIGECRAKFKLAAVK